MKKQEHPYSIKTSNVDTDTLWNTKSPYQEKYDELLETLEQDLMKSNTKKFSPWKHPKKYDAWSKDFWLNHSEYVLINSMAGIYYAYYNDGDNVVGAIENNRTQGFDSLPKLLGGLPFDTPDVVVNFLKSPHPIDKRNLEKVMNATIEYLVEINK